MIPMSKLFRLALLLPLFPFLSSCASLEAGMRMGVVPEQAAADQAQPEVRPITSDLIASENKARRQMATQHISALAGGPKPYLIGNGDLLSILVWNHPELNIAAAGAQALSSSTAQVLSGAQSPSAYAVDQNGQIQFPYVGAIKLAGLTELQARKLLASRLVKSIRDPDLTVRVMQFRSKKVYVDGEVKSPGNQVIDDVPMTLLEAITRAGGMLPSADQSRIQISRGDAFYPINLPELVRQGTNPSDIMLTDGDVVRIRNRDENKIYVLGEVTAPTAMPMVNGRLTLAQALGEAGGLNQLSAAARQVYVVRNAADATPQVFNLDARSPVALALADNFELNPRDVVFVDATGLTRFNRNFSQILSNAASATSSYYNVRVPRQ